MAKPKVLKIKRAKWRRGGTDLEKGPTMLLNGQGLMCCLGFDALACGLKREDIKFVYRPDDIDDAPENYLQTRSARGPKGPVERAICANDSTEISERERERRVRKAMIALGWDDVVFV